MANVTFSGTVTAQAAAGQTVTIVVTKPDNTTETLTTVTKADVTPPGGIYSITKQYMVAGAYSAQASGTADGSYSSWQTPPKAFTVTLTPRTGTLNVALA